MKKINLLLVGTILLFVVTSVSAKNFPEPIPSKNIPVETQQYLKTLYDNINKLEVVTVNPDGARTGRLGEILLLNNSGTYYLEVCVSSPNGTVWKGIVLSDTP